MNGNVGAARDFSILACCLCFTAIVGFASASDGANTTFEFYGNFGTGPSKAAGEFNYPSGVAVDATTGDVFVMDTMFQRIQVFDQNGNYVTKWSASGGLGLSVDSGSHDVYVAFPTRNKVVKYDTSGNIIAELGGYGILNGQFKMPRDVSVDQMTGNVYVLDGGNRRVQIFDSSGTFIKAWNAQVTAPFGISVDPSGQYVYIANSGGNNILKYSIDGVFLLSWGSTSSATGHFRWPRGMAVDSTGNVYVADSDMERLQVFDSLGNFLRVIQGPHNWLDGPFHPRAVDVNTTTGRIYVAASYANRIDCFSADATFLFSWGHQDSGPFVFNDPKGIAVDLKNGNVVVADTDNHLIKTFNRHGAFVGMFGGPPAVDRSLGSLGFPMSIAVDGTGLIWGLNEGIYYPDDPTWGPSDYVRAFDAAGQYVQGFSDPDFWAGMHGIAINSTNHNIYVADTPNDLIAMFDQTGQLLQKIGSRGGGTGQFLTPSGLAIDQSSGDLYVVDSGNNRIQKLDSAGNVLGVCGGPGTGPGDFYFNQFSGIDVDGSGNIYVADSRNARIQMLDRDCNYLAELGVFGWGTGRFAWPAGVAVYQGMMYVLDTGGNEVEMYDVVDTCEDAEDGTISGWRVYDKDPVGAQIMNVFDVDSQSNAIQLLGDGIKNGFQLRNADMSNWGNIGQFVVQWKMKYSENFKIYIDAETIFGHRYIYYTPVAGNNLGSSVYVHHGLGKGITDGNWHTVIRDLQADLAEAQPGNEILAVNGFFIRGSGYLDEIELRGNIPPAVDTDQDGLLDKDEFGIYSTNPSMADTDGDGLNDGEEVGFWGVGGWGLDYDNDGIVNLLDWDSDGDGRSDGEEVASGTDPADPNSLPPVVYEDAEDGLNGGWRVYDNTPSGAHFLNVYDIGRLSRVIKLEGTGINNGFLLHNPDMSKWGNTRQFVVHWSMKYNENVKIYLDVETARGYRYIYYTPSTSNDLGTGVYVHHGLGFQMRDGAWHTFVRDLQVDLAEAQPGNQILSVNGFLIRGSGYVDDISLL